MLTLYFAPGASSMAPHIALHEIGALFTPRPLSFARNETRAPDFLAVNPEGKVPALLIDGRVLTEVVAILFYLARRHPEAALLPDDAEGQAQAISWMSFLASTVHPARRQGPDHASRIYDLADRRLGAAPGGGAWALGAYSIADIHLFRLYWRFAASLGVPAGRFRHLQAHHDRMLARPAVARTIEIERAIGYELPA
jgi:glutathione S-transferase